MTDRPPDRAPRATLLDTPSSLLGTDLSHYRILEHLGGGGMGVVYRAVDTRLERQVALKFLPPEIGHLKEAKERFVQEARAASALDHPNICPIYEIDETEDGQLFLAMAYDEGETLKRRIARGRLEIDEALDVVRQIASGLGASHAQDIIHRDVKPANVWLARAGHESSARVRLLDFGLAKVLGQSDLTRTGSSMGTPAYMSPEHALGERVDPRTDLWSLGVVLYEALTAEVPFTGNSIPAVMYALLSTDPRPLRELRPGVPAEVERIVTRLLEKEVERRYASCGELLADLEAVPAPSLELAEPPVPAAPPSAGGSAGASAFAKTVTLRSPAPPLGVTPPLALADPVRTPARVAPAPAADVFDAHLRSGLEAALARDYRGAAEAFEKALALRPGDSRARFNLDKVRARLLERG